MTTVIGRRSACSSATIPSSQRGQGRHVEEAEPDAVRGELVDHETPEQAARGDGAHLVIQLRPAHASAAVAETDELDRVRVGDSRGGGDVDPSMACPPFGLGVRRPARADARSVVPATAKPGRPGRSTSATDGRTMASRVSRSVLREGLGGR